MPSPVQQAAEKFKAEQAMEAERDEFETFAAPEQPDEPAPLVPPAPSAEVTEDAPPVLGDVGATPAPALRRGDPAPEDDDPEDDDTPARRAMSGKYVILVLDCENAPAGWTLLRDEEDGEPVVTPQLHRAANRDLARAAALDDERNEGLANAVRADYLRWQLVAIPATSWAPAPMEPRLVKTTWRVVA